MKAVAVRTILVTAIAAGQAVAGDALDEAAMFGDTATLIDSAAVVNTAAAAEQMKERKSAAMSGDITCAVSGFATRDFFDDPGIAETRLSNLIVGNLMLDVRLLQSFKAFGNVEARYVPDSGTALFNLRELFIDANIGKKAYLRAGKQVLQWGRCYFWNPTDLINVEKKSFLTRLGYREGTYGLRAHVPFGTAWNLYGFLDARKAPRLDSLAGAAKVEFLVGGTEMSLSLWDKRGDKPVYGFDISSQVLKVNVVAELGLHQQYRLRGFRIEHGMPVLTTENKAWVPRACLGLNRSFGVLGIQDRLTLVGEVYYNHVGSTARTLEVPDITPLLALMDPTRGRRPASFQETAGFMMMNGLYEMHTFSRVYAAFFGSLGRFIASDMTLTLNAIANLNQRCAIITTGLSWQGLNDFTLGLSVNSFVGPRNTEYTIAGDAAQVQVTAGVTF